MCVCVCLCVLHFTFDWYSLHDCIWFLCNNNLSSTMNILIRQWNIHINLHSTFGTTMVCACLCGWKAIVLISVCHRLQLVSIWRPLGRLQAGWSSETHNRSPAPGSGSGSGQDKAPDCWPCHLPYEHAIIQKTHLDYTCNTKVVQTEKYKIQKQCICFENAYDKLFQCYKIIY